MNVKVLQVIKFSLKDRHFYGLHAIKKPF